MFSTSGVEIIVPLRIKNAFLQEITAWVDAMSSSLGKEREIGGDTPKW